MLEKRIKTNRIELQVREYKQDGEAIIFLHFGGANLMAWQRVIPYFQDRYHLILVDLRGHGRSDKPRDGYHMDEMARDIAGILQPLGLESAHIVGSSLGAEVGLSVAAHYPKKVLSLVCEGALYSESGPYGIWEGTEKAFEEHVAQQMEYVRDLPEKSFPSVDAYVDDRREVLEKIGWWNRYVEAMERYGAFERSEGEFTKSMGKEAMKNYMAHYFQYRFEDYYRKVQCPLLMLAEKEPENEREIAAMQGLCALAAQGKIVEINGWEHPYGWLLNPEGASKAILQFLGEVEQE